jgi:hypothetical protein
VFHITLIMPETRRAAHAECWICRSGPLLLQNLLNAEPHWPESGNCAATMARATSIIALFNLILKKQKRRNGGENGTLIELFGF